MRKSDAIVIAFCVGALVVNVAALLYLIIGCPTENTEWVSQLASASVIYYLTAVLIYIVFATGLCI